MALMCNFLKCSVPSEIEHGPAGRKISLYLQGTLQLEAFYFSHHRLCQHQAPILVDHEF